MIRYEDAHRPQAQAVVDGVIINPALRPGFDDTPHEDRCELEEADWWGVPYIEIISFDLMRGTLAGEELRSAKEAWLSMWPDGNRYEVRCLDGGAWDRSTNKGAFASLSAAIAVAKAISQR
ncbi:MAG: hypothetical protein ACRC9M_06575 [Aeromonas sp.]